MNLQPSLDRTALAPDIVNRAKGALLGLAVGDALGAPLEFSKRDSLPRVTDMIGGGPFRLQPGEWTDDTSMALALGDSLLHSQGLEPFDLMTRFVRWWREGAYSHNGRCFDIGTATAHALSHFELTGEAYAGLTSEYAAGNGALMRLAPVAMFYLTDRATGLQAARDQCRTTHGAAQCIDACSFFIALLQQAIWGEIKHLRPTAIQAHPDVASAAATLWEPRPRDWIRSGGYVCDTLSAALWSVCQTRSFEDALVLAVNLGHDSDTVGAVTGQLAGALYGYSAIPERWLRPLVWRKDIELIAERLIQANLKPKFQRKISSEGSSPP